MTAGQSQIKPSQIIEAVLKYRWLIIISLSVSLTLGLARTILMDRTYESSTLILVQPQEVPSDYVQSVVSSGIESRLNTISQQIMSRSNLEKIIDKFGLYQGNTDMYLEDKIADLRRRIEVNISRGKRDSESFTIKFRGNRPERVRKIANTLASYFMDENLKVREAQAVGTSEFLSAELEKTRNKLKSIEKELAEYRARHMGALPDELESNLRTLDRLQTQLTDKQSALRDAVNSETVLQSRLAQLKKRAAQRNSNKSGGTDGNGLDTRSSEEKKLEALKARLDDLLGKYTEKHPDVIRLKSTIEKMKKNIAGQETGKKESGDTRTTGSIPSGSGAAGRTNTNDSAIMELAIQLKQVNNLISGLTSDISEIERKMDKYEKRVEMTPKREEELQSLKRDYANIQSVYNSLMDRKLEAELSVNMERKQKGEQFRIIDHARTPQKPVSPDVRQMFVIFFGIGAGIAGGIIFLLLMIDNTVKSDDDIEATYGIPVIAEIAPIKKPGAVVKTRIEIAALAVGGLYVTGIVVCFMVLYLQGIERTLGLVKSLINM